MPSPRGYQRDRLLIKSMLIKESTYVYHEYAYQEMLIESPGTECLSERVHLTTSSEMVPPACIAHATRAASSQPIFTDISSTHHSRSGWV